MISRFAFTCGLVLLAFQTLAVAQNKTADAPPLFKTSITLDSAILAQGQPAIVTITVENTLGQELELSSRCSFDLRNLSKESVARNRVIVGDRYWSPVNILNGTPTELNIIDPEKLKQGIVVGQVPKVSLKFAKDETKTFTVDLTKVFWNDVMYSIWPRGDLFKIVPKGSYSLIFELRHGGRNVESNAIEVSVK